MSKLPGSARGALARLRQDHNTLTVPDPNTQGTARRRQYEDMADNPLPYQIRKYVPRPPVPGSYKGLMLALHAAARELGMPMGGFGGPASVFEPHEEVMWRLPSGVRPSPLSKSGLIPPIVRVRLPVRDPERTRSQFISAVVEAASVGWYRPTEAIGVREPLESLWPQLRERGPRTEGLAEHLETVIETPAETSVESSVEWFYHAAETAMEAAFLAAAPVMIAAQIVTASGSHASIAPDIPSGCLPRSASITITQGRTLEETVCNAVEVVLLGHGIEPNTEDYAHKARYLSAAMLASAEPVPDTPAAAQG